MDITQWYAVALGGVVALSIIASLFLTIFKCTRTDVKLCFLKHVYYPQIHKCLRGSEKTTRLDVVVIVAFLVGNVLCTTIRVKDVPGLTRRSGLMSTIILMPLSLGGHMNLIANHCGIRLGSYARMHRWLGRVAIVQGLVHTAAAVSLQKPDLRMPSDIGGLIVSYVRTSPRKST
jgi:hypothetical protein